MAVRDVTIEEIDYRGASEDVLREINAFGHAMAAESHPEDPPEPFDVFRAWRDNISPNGVPREFLVRDDNGLVIGRLETWWEREENNQHVLDIDLAVLPEQRRAGVGRRLLATAVEAAEEAEKRLLVGHTIDRVTAGEDFAKRVGAEAALVGHTNRLAIADVDRAMAERWVEEGPVRAPGYSLFAIDGAVPDEFVEQFVTVLGVMNTAPRENLDMEDWVITPEQLRHMERSMLSVGAERRYLAARLDATGEFVGFSELWRYSRSEPNTCRQWGTGVFPEHRGHALGKWLKAVNILRVMDEWPEVVDIRTHNADSNDPMLGINRALGFEPYTVDVHWQIATEKARDYVGS